MDEELWECASCEKLVPESETEYVETSPASWEEPSDGVSLCLECLNETRQHNEDFWIEQRENSRY